METEPKMYEVTENDEVVQKTAVELVRDYIPEYVRLVESSEEWKGRNYIGNLVVHEDEEAEAALAKGNLLYLLQVHRTQVSPTWIRWTKDP